MARILYVDDESSIVLTKKVVLEQAGHTVTCAMSAREAVEKIQAADHDLIVTDWRLGDADGRVVVQAAKNKGSGNTPVVVVTGYFDEAVQAPKPQADLYLTKPGDPEEFLLILDALLHEHGYGHARILCVAEESPLLMATCAALEGEGYKVTTASSASEAIEKMQASDYDAVVISWHMSDADGRAVVQGAKKQGGETPPVVVVTEYYEKAIRGPRPAADKVLPRPTDPKKLLVNLDRLLKKRGFGRQT